MDTSNTADHDRLDKRVYESNWAEQLVSERDRFLWSEYKATSRVYLRQSSLLVRWEFVAGQPRIISTLTVNDIGLSFKNGMTVALRSSDDRDLVVTQFPRPIRGMPFFMWVPYFHEIRFVSRNWDDSHEARDLRFSVCIRQAQNPTKTIIEGVEYLNTLQAFKAMWPEQNNIWV